MVTALADEIEAAYHAVRPLSPPSSRGTGFDLGTAYGVESELARRRVDAGHHVVGRKVGFANRAMWRILKLDALVWAHMYDDTVRHAPGNEATLALRGKHSPRIEPEIVFKTAKALPSGVSDPTEVLRHVEWIALGFEIIDCLYPDWKFQPVDFVAAYGLHAALIVGEPQRVTAETIATLAEQLPQFSVRLSKNGVLVEEGSGKNALRSPALCLGELASVVRDQPLEAGELVSTGTLTAAQPLAAGDTWTAQVGGISLPALALHVTD